MQNNQYKNILIIRTDRIGDVVVTTPAVRAVRQNFPQARLTMLVAPLTLPLIQHNPHLDEVMVDDRFQEHKGLFGFLKLIRSLRKRKFDLVIVYHTKKRTNALAYLSGIPQRLGYKNNKFGFLLNYPVFDDRPQGLKHEAKYCLDLLGHIGVENKNTLCEVFTKNVNKNSILPKGQVIVIHAGASDPAKRWPSKHFITLIQTLQKKFEGHFVLIGSKDTMNVSEQIKKNIKGNLIDLTGQTSVEELMAVLQQSDLLISNDSGPAHIAAAVGTPVISIFTRNDPGINPERWAPLGLDVRVVCAANEVIERVKKEQDISFEKSAQLSDSYTGLIPVQDVLESVDDIFKLC